jgi:hypothetical protein
MIETMRLAGAGKTKRLTAAQRQQLTTDIELLREGERKHYPSPADRWDTEPEYRTWLKQCAESTINARKLRSPGSIPVKREDLIKMAQDYSNFEAVSAKKKAAADPSQDRWEAYEREDFQKLKEKLK